MQLYFVFMIVFRLIILCLTSAVVENVPVSSNCSLVTDQNVASSLQKAFDNEKLVIYATVSIDGETGAFSQPHVKTVLDTTKWIFTKDETARSILHFNEQYRAMSLYTLSLSVEKVNIQIKQQPENCFMNSSVDELEHAVRHFLLGLIDHAKESNEYVNICNKHIVESQTGTADVQTVCCEGGLNKETEINCKEHSPGKWFSILEAFTYFLMIVSLGFSVNARPSFLFEKTVEINKKLDGTLNIKKTSYQVTDNPIAADSFQNIKSAMQNVKNGCIGTIQFSSVTLNLQTRKLSKPDSNGNGFLKFIWDFIFLCDIKDYSESTNSCLDDRCMYRCGCSWYKIFKYIKYAAVAITALLPIILRFIYLGLRLPYETFIIEEMHARNLTISGSLESFFDSTVGVVLEIMSYVILLLILVIIHFSVTDPDSGKTGVCEDCCVTPLDTLIDKKESQRRICNTFMKILLQKCNCCKRSKFGIFNICLLPLSMCAAILYLLYRTFPTVYVLKNICCPSCNCSQTNEYTPRSDRDKDCNAISVIAKLFVCICLGALFFFFIGSGIRFYIKCIVYIITGIILNYNSIIRYIAPFAFILLYGHGRLQAVNTRLDAFEVFINESIRQVFSSSNPRIMNVDQGINAQNDNDSTCYYALAICDKERRIMTEKGEIRLRIQGGVVFVEKSDITVKPYISKQLTHHVASLSHPSCPGSPLMLYLKTVYQVLCRAMILAFILNIILALGKDMSAAIKTLFLFLTGYILTWIKQFSVDPQSTSSKDSRYWQDVFENKTDVLENFTEVLTVERFDTDVSQQETINADLLQSDVISYCQRALRISPV